MRAQIYSSLITVLAGGKSAIFFNTNLKARGDRYRM